MVRAAPATSAASLSVALVGDAAMRRLNATFRGKDRTTDVLSFPAGGGPDPGSRRLLGEIAISLPQAARQARAAGHPLAREARILLIHGYLHLLGYDHEVDDGTMLRLQGKLVVKLLGRGRRG